MKKIFLLSFFISIYGLVFSQTAEVSIPDKLNNKLYDFDIIGRTSEGILILKFGKGENNVVEAYSDNMTLRWKKSIDFGDKNVNIEKMVGVHNGLLLIYSVRTREQVFLYAQKLKDNLEPISEIMMDSLPFKKTNQTSGIFVRSSKDKSKFLIYRSQSENDQINFIGAYCVNENLQLIWSKNFEVDASYGAVKVEKSLIDNAGNPLFVFNSYINKPRKQNEQNEKFSILHYDFLTNQINQYKFLADGKFIFDSYFEIDNFNKTVIGCGFYSDNFYNYFSGVFYYSVDLQKKSVTQQQFKLLPSEVVVKMLGKYSSDGKNELSDFEIKNLVLRNDGGVILIAEMFFKTIESRTVPNVYGNYSYIDYDFFHYHDLLVLSVNTDGTIDWNSVLKKKQVSEEDEGYYSSFALLTAKGELNFIFNEEIFKKTNVINYRVNNSGMQERKNILNTDRRDLMLMPRFAKQISFNEIIVPSLDRNFVKFVKFTF